MREIYARQIMLASGGKATGKIQPHGSIYLHCDHTASHHLREIMDAIFGRGNFRRELVWNQNTASGYKTRADNWIRSHDTLVYYVKNRGDFYFKKHHAPHKPEYVARFGKTDENGRHYRDDRGAGRRQYLNETNGVAFTDVWSDIMSFQQNSAAPEYGKNRMQNPADFLKNIIMNSGGNQCENREAA